MKTNYTSQIKRGIIKGGLLGCLIAGSLLSLSHPVMADDATEEPADEPIPWIGDIYRISAEDLECDLKQVEEMGGKVLFSRDDLYLIIFPESAIKNSVSLKSSRKKIWSKNPRLKPITLPRQKNLPTMELARYAKDANFIHEGVGLPCKFDGSGVVVGFSDLGFDPNHSNFLNADGTESRVRRFVNYELEAGRIDRLETPEAISGYITDYQYQTHATHVAGIMAGRGGGGKYIGMAPNADIVATTSDLYDVVILAGIEEIIAYAKSVNKPAVINISIGSYGGPHDGTSLFCQYLDKCAEDAIICISSGNEGVSYNHIGHTFKSADDKVTFRWQDNSYVFLNVRGTTDIYSEDDSPLKVGLYLTRHNSNSDRPYTGPMVDLSEEPEWVLTSNPEQAAADPRYHYDENYAKYFTGEIYIQGGIDPENGRFFARITYNADTDVYAGPSQPWGKYQVGGYVQGVEGKKVDLYADGGASSFISNQGSPRPDSNMSISDFATAKNVISVGAYWISEGTEMYNGNVWGGGTPMTICNFTSYGTLSDGRITPMTSAPGGPITSSYSTPFIEYASTGGCAYEYEGHYWGLNSGTSMSTPYVAGAIATWLQANPMLTSKEVQELVINSNDTENYPFEANPRHGLGVFDPYKGLKLLAEHGYTDVESVLMQSLFANYSNGVLRINNPDAREVHVELYSIDGKVISASKCGSSETITLSRETLGLSAYEGLAICRLSAPGASTQILKITTK